MRQLAVAAADVRGNFVCLSEPSRGARKSGISAPEVLGRRFWDFVDQISAVKIRDSFSRCLIDETRQQFTNTSIIGGHVEHWETVMLPCRGAEVLAYSREIMQPSTITLTPEDRTIISRLADDQTVEEVAAGLHMAAATVASRLKRIREKLDIKTNTGLIAFCLRYGVL